MTNEKYTPIQIKQAILVFLESELHMRQQMVNHFIELVNMIDDTNLDTGHLRPRDYYHSVISMKQPEIDGLKLMINFQKDDLEN